MAETLSFLLSTVSKVYKYAEQFVRKLLQQIEMSRYSLSQGLKKTLIFSIGIQPTAIKWLKNKSQYIVSLKQNIIGRDAESM